MRASSSRHSDGIQMPATILAYDIETIAPQVADGSFPPWPTHQPVAIGFAEARHRGGGWSFDIEALVVAHGTNESDLIHAADTRMAKADTVTSFNGSQFDALVLRLSAQRARLWNLKALADHAAAHRYGGEHADLADLYSSYGRKVGLATICDQIGIPVKTDVGGADVAVLWDAGETERIRKYVMEDAVATLVLWFAWNASRAGDEALVTRPMAALARHIAATPDLAHLSAFLDCALMRWCRPRALHADIAAALERVTARLRREEDERAFATA
ncbi:MULTISPECIES: ribonuclease H-like domain-containing protein [unclassified Sphingomonas]|uniref:ribonuclease H-like domain-containing protein n=1 Tax=unclassified Sphingomonas TaxID=196159 RepID=UPI000E7166FC|nr:MULTISPECIES: ribonuclease H-like domain-containing protein [unclassified Sphingomonas]RKE45885.1 putative 3'-5' exonuclease similar to PolB exonuclease domain [Sphingomonas sp. PP-CC-1A-547]TCM06833.1 putative 3'-5' exonuclease similar to PolB exonuclease domain [Sphingomonas sp. PP-CC-3G-468]